MDGGGVDFGPAVSCGTSPSITGTDQAGEVTMGTGAPTGCVITFNSAYTSAPYCSASWKSNLASMSYTVSNTAITTTQTGTTHRNTRLGQLRRMWRSPTKIKRSRSRST